MQARQVVIGTAGHIDHGKTSLIRALTGVDLDRLPEERERGITIALGFTSLSLPSGRVASFVDVPGHERLVRTMIAGASGLDAVMLAVSAVEGVMPQTREHLAILELLEVKQGLVALTMTDLVDEEMLELAIMDVEEAVAGTFLEGAPILATAAGPQPAGLEALKAALDRFEPTERPEAGLFRLPVDRAFVQRGFGTVVTGTVRSGAVADGAEVEILPEGIRARVRGIQVHGEKVDRATPGRRTAVNLAGVERDDLARGMVVVEPGRLEVARVLDARLQVLASAPTLPSESRVRLLVGTAEVMAVLALLEGEALVPGRSQLVQLRTDAPLVALPGDRFVLRRESPVETLGGGKILDPWAPRARRRDLGRVTVELARLEAGEEGVLLARAGDAGLNDAGMRARKLDPSLAVRLADRHLHPSRVAHFEEILLARLGEWHLAHPLMAGVPRRELHRAHLAQLSDRAFDELVARMGQAGRLVLEGPRLRLPDFLIRPGPEHEARIHAIRAEALLPGLEGLRAADLLARDSELTHYLFESGSLVKVGDRALHPDPLGSMTAKVRGWFQANPLMSAGDFKELTGLSRKHAIPLLEWLDASGLTRRVGDNRVAGNGVI